MTTSGTDGPHEALKHAVMSLTGNTTAEKGGNASVAQANQLMNKSVYDRWALTEDNNPYVPPVVFIIIFIVGLIGNGTLIVSVLANKVMRNVPNILIVSLSMGDFLLILVAVPISATYFTFENWPYGQAACSLFEFMMTLSLGVSVFTLCALSADRYVAIVNPMAKMTGRTQRTTVAIAVGIWILSTLLAIPDAVFSTILTIEENNTINTYCLHYPIRLHPTYPRIFHASRLVVYLILPMLFIAFFYIMMARVLVQSNELMPVETKTAHSNHQRQMDARKKVARVVLSFVIIFIICWLPRHIYLMWFYFTEEEFNDFWLVFKIVGFCLTFVNSCVNPFALYFLSGHFRKYYNRYLFCLCRQKRYSAFEPSSTMQQFNSTAGRRVSNTRMSVVNSQC
ncbi:neuromedin-B receptor [Elysia marginata]|uniref:Neuromedin-B receptor n=1 Tax=Elysia marginata TaxID=1093978 RepID=A0AAV4IP75_9GAST|nr:neuromedin-B receptor [Elysia marginata]